MSRVAALLLCCALGAVAVAAAPAPFRKPSAAPKEVGLADLLALPEYDYRADPYLRVAASLQAMGKVKAVKVLQRLAAKDKSPLGVRLAVLCRMLYQAKGKASFRTFGHGWLYVNAAGEMGPITPVEMVDGVPFFLGSMCIRHGIPESPTDYLRYCEKECEWNTERFKPLSKAEKRKALDKLMSLPELKGKLDRSYLEGQIR